MKDVTSELNMSFSNSGFHWWHRLRQLFLSHYRWLVVLISRYLLSYKRSSPLFDEHVFHCWYKRNFGRMAEKPNDDESNAEWFFQRESLEGLDWVPIYLRISELMLLRYEEFVDLLARFNGTLNLLTRDEPDSVQFTVVPNSDTNMLWKVSVIIKCSRVGLGIFPFECADLVVPLN